MKKWYHAEKTFYDRVSKSVDNIPIADLELPVCPENYNEGDYNTMIARSSDDFCLMDKKTVSVEGGQKKIEACVFITRPTKSVVLYSQVIGRGLRGPLMGGNEECLLVDIDDNLELFDNSAAFTHFDDYWKS